MTDTLVSQCTFTTDKINIYFIHWGGSVTIDGFEYSNNQHVTQDDAIMDVIVLDSTSDKSLTNLTYQDNTATSSAVTLLRF
mmetsp:Transcript_19485/g.16696  ORF Transcript_19485/g.16696 Transcript_19485/m.16696 type:complete len:81 (+) Transcript_19485:269-511(+)